MATLVEPLWTLGERYSNWQPESATCHTLGGQWTDISAGLIHRRSCSPLDQGTHSINPRYGEHVTDPDGQSKGLDYLLSVWSTQDLATLQSSDTNVLTSCVRDLGRDGRTANKRGRTGEELQFFKFHLVRAGQQQKDVVKNLMRIEDLPNRPRARFSRFLSPSVSSPKPLFHHLKSTLV
ncbi:hypothetical protein RRG08_055721 [Elysia crispata]|uniref:Uncharacterized protein n=1 Tax=Elysia crispata TaxID=231223 RepID=A0AAE1B1P2_9GAST|nr:hypothetical protein RRG08_055721 [Elysia crispata]